MGMANTGDQGTKEGYGEVARVATKLKGAP
jgi:hypothetical protein